MRRVRFEREGCAEVQGVYPSTDFAKRLCDVFDDEVDRIAKEVGSRAKAFKLVKHNKKLVRFFLRWSRRTLTILSGPLSARSRTRSVSSSRRIFKLSPKRILYSMASSTAWTSMPPRTASAILANFTRLIFFIFLRTRTQTCRLS